MPPINSPEEDRCGWAAMIFPAGIADVVGAVRGSRRLHWTQAAARAEAEAWVSEMGIGPIAWQILDDQMLIGRSRSHTIVIRSILLPFTG